MKKATIAALAAAMAVCAHAESIDNILDSIRVNNIELRALTADADATRADLAADNALAGPAAEFSPFWQKGVDGLSSSELIVSQEIEFPTIYAARRRAAALEGVALDRRYDVACRDILLQAKLRCLDLARLQAQRAIIDRRHSYAHDVLRLIDRLNEAGGATALDVNKTRMEHNAIEASVAVNEAALLEVRRELEALNGYRPLAADSLAFPAIEALPSLESVKESLLGADADIASAAADIAAARQGVAVSRQSWLPSINAGFRRNAAPGEAQNGFVVGLSFPVWSNAGRVRAARARQTAAELRADDARRNAESLIASRYARLGQLRAIIDTYDEPMLFSTLALLAKAVESRAISVLDYYTESDAVYQRLGELIDARWEYHTLMAELTAAML